MKRVSRENLKQFLHGVHGDLSTLATSMQGTIDEIYQNLTEMDAHLTQLDGKFGGFFQVDEENEMITVFGLPPSIGGVIDEETETINIVRKEESADTPTTPSQETEENA